MSAQILVDYAEHKFDLGASIKISKINAHSVGSANPSSCGFVTVRIHVDKFEQAFLQGCSYPLRFVAEIYLCNSCSTIFLAFWYM